MPVLPIQAGLTALIVTAVSLTASKLLIQWLVDYRWPIAVYAVIAAVVGYGPLLACCLLIARRWGTGSLGRDFGFRFKVVDLGWGPLTWLAAFAAQFVAAVIVLTTRLPFESNTEGLAERAGDRAYVISFAILAVVCAPLIEELVFRGAVMRGLMSRMPTWPTIGLQALLFGCAHIDPVRGWNNVGLVLILSAVGLVLGGAAYLTRRLAASMIAHALINTVALVFVLTR